MAGELQAKVSSAAPISRRSTIITGIFAALVPSILLRYANLAHFTGAIGGLIYVLVGTLVCGPLFAGLQSRMPGPVWARGVLFGLAFWCIDTLVVSAALGQGPLGNNIGAWGPAVSLIFFLLWGASLGAIYGLLTRGWRAWRVISTAFLALVIVETLNYALLFQGFDIANSSMLPTLARGARAFVAKYAYGYSRYSLPFSLPLFSGRILSRDPSRGDLVAFRVPKKDNIDAIRRVVGLSGDRIQMFEDALYINGAPVKRERISITAAGPSGPVEIRFQETLPNGVTYVTAVADSPGFHGNTSTYTVPPGHFFVIGDNRDNSDDSRALGYIPFENLIGRVLFIFRQPGAD